jgi:iron(II)-dependent oxidoreductase
MEFATMHPSSGDIPARWAEAHAARTASASLLATLLQASRARTLALVEAYEAALGATLPVPCSAQLNPPLWELGHIGWFQEFWLARNPQRQLGVKANPDAPRMASCLPHADALYNSSLVAHASRWHLPLPDLQATKAFLKDSLDSTLALLASEVASDAALYFYRLALFHEDMHGEAAVYMAQALGITLPQAVACKRQPAAAVPVQTLRLEADDWTLGYIDTGLTAPPEQTANGFAFDNELAPHTVYLEAYEIDDQPVSWRRYLPFVAAGGYTDPKYWSEAGWQWLTAQTEAKSPTDLCPRYLRHSQNTADEPVWEHCLFGQWQALNLDTPACHLSYFEAEAWCHWAGRQLPTEAQWEQAAMTQPSFFWGEVWEWTASTFAPYPGFEAHPYRDYSAPWFGNRPVLRGASLATSARMAHPRYRNYFTPERNDIQAGFRTCAG